MAHLVIEYTRNIKSEADIPGLLKNANKLIASVSQDMPLAGIRSRALELQNYDIADGAGDYAFVHATLRVDASIPEALKRATSDELFKLLKQHFAALYEKRYLALSMELVDMRGLVGEPAGR
jgi:5-carboxymethyl-2-hydroxymuconate isomerase